MRVPMRFLAFLVALFIFSNAQADVLFQDPTRKTVVAAFDKLSEEEVKNLSGPNVSKKQYLLGLLYLNGDQRFHVEKNCKKAVGLFQESWRSDVADAGYALATMYYHGVCVDKDIDKARELATRTAQDGYILAQRMLGLAYIGKKWQDLYPYNIEKGIYWLKKAGDAGDRVSAGQLASMYDKGEQVPKNEKKSFSWLKKGIFNKYEKGNSIGFPVLAESYEKGIGTEVDLVKAYKYYDLIGTAGIQSKERIAKKMTQEQIDEGRRESQAWQKEHNIQVGSDFIRRVK